MKCHIKKCKNKATTFIQTESFCAIHYRRFRDLRRSKKFESNQEAFEYFLKNPEYPFWINPRWKNRR